MVKGSHVVAGRFCRIGPVARQVSCGVAIAMALRSEGHQHRLHALVALERLPSQILADAGLAEPARGQDVVTRTAVAVDPHRAGLDLPNRPHRAVRSAV